jgi:dipeptidyl-peptidase-4
MRISPTRPLASLAVLLLLSSGALAEAQTQDASAILTNTRIFAGRDFRTEQFGPARWLGDGSSYTTVETSVSGSGQDLVRYATETGDREVLVSGTELTPEGSETPLKVENYSWSADQNKLLIYTNSKRVWRTNTRGDYWVLDRTTESLHQVGRFAKPSTLMFAKFSPDGTRIGYVVANDLYVEDLADGRVTRLTDDGSRTRINGTFDWVYEEELGLQDGWRWSPDGSRVAYWQLDADGVRDFMMIRTTDSVYSNVVPVQYPKAGEENSSARIGVVSSLGGPTTWLRIEGDPRNNYLARMDWASSREELVVQRLNRLQNTLDVLLADAKTGEVHSILTERDSAWVEVVDDFVWLDGGKSFTWLSERDGWTHAYVVSRDGSNVRLVTPGDYDVISVLGVDAKGEWLYYIASPGNPAQRYLWRTRIDGRAAPERLTPAGSEGTHSYDISPGYRWALHTFSRFGMPPALDVVRLPDHRASRVLVDNTDVRLKLERLRTGTTEFFTLPGADGVTLNAWMMTPPGFDPNRQYPVLFYVYGGPGSQTVNDSWGGTRYLWHLMLTQKGYIVASVDNRGTGARGRDWRKLIYGQLGVVETRDQAAAAAAFARFPFVDASRVGIWGWSYGGFMSLNTLFQAPDVYRAAVSVAPVTHWKFYDTIYTERYNGLPRQNADGYDRGSPLSYVDGLKGELLLIHGSGDDNVHYQNSEALINALVQANKPFAMMEYPNRTHSISGGNTSVHLFDTITRFLDERLAGGQVLTP